MTTAETRPVDQRANERTDERITQLEIKLSFAEDLLDTLNTLVTRQQDQIDLLLREVSLLRRQREDDAPSSALSLRDERPPHY